MNLHQIYSPERDIYLRELKERVICGQPVADSEGYSDFVSEWQRSVEHNVDCRLPALGDEHRDFRVFENVSTFTKFKLALLDDFVIKKEDALAELDCAIFYLDNNLSTFRTAGSPQLLEELKRKGLRHGTQFTVENVGALSPISAGISRANRCAVSERKTTLRYSPTTPALRATRRRTSVISEAATSFSRLKANTRCF